MKIIGNRAACIHIPQKGLFFFLSHIRIDFGMNADTGKASAHIRPLPQEYIGVEVAFNMHFDLAQGQPALLGNDITNGNNTSGKGYKQIFQWRRSTVCSTTGRRLISSLDKN
jgi:hypothetical protein